MHARIQTGRPASQKAPIDPADPELRRQAHLALIREMIDLGMDMARAAAAEVLQPEPDEEPARPTRHAKPQAGRFRSADPHLSFARSTRAVRQAIALESRIAEGAPSRVVRYTPANPNQILLRKALHDSVRNEPDRAVRNQLCRDIDERLSAEARDNPHARIEDTLIAITELLGLDVDVTKLPDVLLGMPPRSYKPDPNDSLRS